MADSERKDTVKIRGAKLLAKALESNGVKYIFGVPGDIENEFFQELGDSDIEFVNVRHEQSGAFMADVYSRLTGEVGVCFSTLGPGATNMLTGLANAEQDRSAVLALSGQLSLDKHFKDSHQFIDLPRLFETVTKRSIMITRAKDIHTEISIAMFEAKTGRPGPVHVTVPINLLVDDASGYSVTSASQEINYRYTEQIGALQQMMVDAKSTIAIVGNGLIRSGASSALERFLEAYNIPAYTSFHGKGVLPTSHPLNLGALSRHSLKAKKVLSNQDLILAISYDIVEGVEPGIWEGAGNVVHIDDCPPSGSSVYRPDLELLGNVKLVLEDLIERCEGHTQEDVALEEMTIKANFPEGIDKMFPMHPAKIIADINSVLGGGGIVVSDVGLHKQFVGLYYDAEEPNAVIFSNGLSSMGFGIPAAMAAKYARPDKKVIAVCGDGGFQMNIQELATAVENNLAVIYIIMNDNAYGMVKDKQLNRTGVTYGAEFKSSVNFAKIAEAYGAKGYTVSKSSDFRNILERAVSSDGVHVIDVPIQQYNELEVMK